MKLENVPCSVCGSTEYDPYLRRKDLYIFLPGEFQLVKCRDCGLVYLNPRPTADSLDEIYPEAYGPYTKSVQNESLAGRKMRNYGLYKRVKAIQRYKKGGRILDVGCATGDFLCAVKEFPGWELYGVEPSPTASEIARKLGLSVQTGTVETADYPDNYFDVITMWNVIEHLADPTAVLTKIRKWLKPDGMLVYNTPNLDSFDAKIFGPYWAGFELPRHFLIFSRSSLQNLLGRTGFRIADTQCFYGSHALFMSGVRFWMRARSSPPKANPRLESVLFSLPMRLLFALPMYILDRLKLSTAPTDFCVKVTNEKA